MLLVLLRLLRGASLSVASSLATDHLPGNLVLSERKWTLTLASQWSCVLVSVVISINSIHCSPTMGAWPASRGNLTDHAPTRNINMAQRTMLPLVNLRVIMPPKVPQCRHCGQAFPHLDGSYCEKCAAERANETIEGHQCLGCGKVFGKRQQDNRCPPCRATEGAWFPSN